MPLFELEKNGETFEIDAPDERAAIAALGKMSEPARTPERPQGLSTLAEQIEAKYPGASQALAGITSERRAFDQMTSNAGPDRAVRGARQVVSGPTLDARLGGVADVVTGAGTTAAMFAAPQIMRAALAAPAMTAGGIVGGSAGAVGAGELAARMGAGEGGQRLAQTAGGLVGGVAGAKGGQALQAAIPTATKAGAKFQDVMAAARNQPVDISGPGNVALRIQQLSERGGSMPKAVRDFLKRVTDPDKGPLVYEEARDFASNISRLSANEFGRLTPAVAREVHGLRVALNKAIENSAAQVGKGDTYRSAMNDYRQSARIREFKDDAVKAAKRIAIPSGLAYGAYPGLSKLVAGE